MGNATSVGTEGTVEIVRDDGHFNVKWDTGSAVYYCVHCTTTGLRKNLLGEYFLPENDPAKLVRYVQNIR